MSIVNSRVHFSRGCMALDADGSDRAMHPPGGHRTCIASVHARVARRRRSAGPAALAFLAANAYESVAPTAVSVYPALEPRLHRRRIQTCWVYTRVLLIDLRSIAIELLLCGVGVSLGMLRGLSVGIRGRRQNLSPRSPVGVFISVLFVPVLLRADASNLSVESEQLTDAQQRRCSSLEAWWTDYTASAVPALIAAAESPHSRGVLAGPVLAAWRNDCGATPLSIDAVFAEATRMFTHDELVASATSSSDEIHSLVPAGDTQALALALLRHGLAQEAAAMRQRVSTLMDGTATRLNLTRTRADSLPSEIGENVGAQVDLVPAHQATRDGTFLRNMSCMRPVARTEQRRYNQDLLHQELENGRRCSKGDCHQRCALTVMDGLVSDAEAFRLIGHFLRVWKKTQRNYQEVKGKPMIDLARSVANSELSDHLFFVRLVERVRSTASAVFGVPLQRLRLAVRTTIVLRQTNA